MDLNQPLLLIQILYMGVLLQLFASLLINAQNYVTMYNEGVYIPFPSFFLKLSNLEFNFYLPELTILNASIYFRRERMAQGPITFTSASHINGFI
jgi:hypothetical protein